jgi:hypothetical protein
MHEIFLLLLIAAVFGALNFVVGLWMSRRK